jgi:hypothetical protein
MAGVVPDTKAARRDALGDRKYLSAETYKKTEVLHAMRATAKIGFLRCVASRSIDYSELHVWVVDNLVALREINQDAPMVGDAMRRLKALKQDMATYNQYKVVPIKEAVAYLSKLFQTDCINITTTRSARGSPKLYVNGLAFMVNTHIRPRRRGLQHALRVHPPPGGKHGAKARRRRRGRAGLHGCARQGGGGAHCHGPKGEARARARRRACGRKIQRAILL